VIERRSPDVTISVAGVPEAETHTTEMATEESKGGLA
jgi:hypothetical protein